MIEDEIIIGAQRLAMFREGPRERSIMLIHGNSSCKEAFIEQFGPLLDAGFGILAVDLPGHGASANAADPATENTLPAYAELLRRVCDQTGVKNPLLFGWSLGGHIAIQMIGDNPNYAGLVICGTPPIGPNPQDAMTAFLPSEFSTVTGDANPSEADMAGYITAVYGTKTPIPDALVRAGHRTDGRSRSSMVAQWQTGEGLHDQRAIVENWHKPLAIVHGVEDAFVSAEFFQSLTLSQPGPESAISMMDHTGHAPFLEQPETFNRILLDVCARSFER